MLPRSTILVLLVAEAANDLLGTPGAQVKFGVLFNDEQVANIFEALVGTLRAAKKRKVGTLPPPLWILPLARPLAAASAAFPSLTPMARAPPSSRARVKIIFFEGEMLLQGAHDNVDVVLLH